MLNELTLLKNGIKAVDKKGLKKHHRHKEISEPGKSNLIRVVIDKQKIVELDIIDGARNKNYWVHGKGNMFKFPAFKLKFPTRPDGVKEFHEWKNERKNPKDPELASCIETLRKKYRINIDQHTEWPDYRANLVEREQLYSGLKGDSLIIHRLIETYLSFSKNGLSLLEHFDKALWSEWQNTRNKDILKIITLVMFANGQELKENGTFQGESITLLLDITSNTTSDSGAHRNWVPELSKLLFDNEENTNQGNCAISGVNTKLVAGTFPKAKCNILGEVIIFSRFKGDVRKRYGKLESESYSLSKSLADELSSALEYVNAKDQGTTWDKLPAENNKTTDLLIAYCREVADINTIKLLSHDGGHDGNNSDSFFDEFDYEEESKQICETFKGKSINLGIEPRIDFLILRKISDGVKKSIFSSSQPLQRLEVASKSWNEACKNTPQIKLALFKKGKKQSEYCSARPISPKKFAILLQKNYTRTIDKKQKPVPGYSFADIMAIFLNEERAPELANRVLQKLLKQFSNLLERLALEKHLPIKSELKKANPNTHHPDALCTVAAIGLLLHKRNRYKEVYMKDLAYKLGQFCAVLDEIHIGYCMEQRGGQIPNRLIGNQAYAAAVENPQKALEITSQRIAVYKTWAEKNSRKAHENIHESKKPEITTATKNAKYAYFWLRDNCDTIHQLISRETFKPSPESKAELLLGYLAGRTIVKK